jgi:hypothetical protein
MGDAYPILAKLFAGAALFIASGLALCGFAACWAFKQDDPQ